MIISEELVALIEEARFKKNYAAKTSLFQQGRNINQVGFLLHGHARAISVSAEGTEIWLSDFGPGDFIGYRPGLIDQPSNFDVQFQVDTELILLTAEKMESLIENASELSTAVREDLAQRL